LLFIVSGASFISKKIKEQGLLRKSHQKTYPLDPGSEILDPRSGKKFIPDPDPGGKKAPDPGSGILLLHMVNAEFFTPQKLHCVPSEKKSRDHINRSFKKSYFTCAVM
jgi:hypothetical protein